MQWFVYVQQAAPVELEKRVAELEKENAKLKTCKKHFISDTCVVVILELSVL